MCIWSGHSHSSGFGGAGPQRTDLQPAPPWPLPLPKPAAVAAPSPSTSGGQRAKEMSCNHFLGRRTVAAKCVGGRDWWCGRESHRGSGGCTDAHVRRRCVGYGAGVQALACAARFGGSGVCRCCSWSCGLEEVRPALPPLVSDLVRWRWHPIRPCSAARGQLGLRSRA
jgi:hypothetical protein